MANSALAGLMEAGSDVVATRSVTIALCCESESGFGVEDEEEGEEEEEDDDEVFI